MIIGAIDITKNSKNSISLLEYTNYIDIFNIELVIEVLLYTNYNYTINLTKKEEPLY